jgi:peptidoglycan/LPS O-acetylase OafA/YrhL
MTYRPDIDGLRAVAVLAVIFYHMGSSVFPGGFVGVDVFFVISGYLITSIILADIESSRFSLLGFYDRRIRRIFPALFVVLAATSVAALVFFLPSDLKSFGKSVFATTVFLSNMLFWRESGYFDAPAEEKPLLHTWSLSVEEQFYVVFPLFLALIYPAAKGRLTLVLLPLLLGSLALSVWFVREDPNTAFYWAPMRAWELLIGAMLAIRVLPAPRTGAVREGLAVLGITLIVWSAVTYSRETPFPGASALVPCLGAAMVIQSGIGGTPPAFAKLLSLRPVVFIGLISYSLYLWHWPILVFAEYYLESELGWQKNLAAFLLMILLSAASWRYVEKPFRGRRPVLGRRGLFAASGALTAITAGFGVLAVATSGFPQRFPAKLAEIESLAQLETPELEQACFFTTLQKARAGEFCRLGADAGATTDFVLWGDSHGGALASAFHDHAARHRVSVISAIYNSCPPLLGVTRHYTGSTYRCREFNDEVLRHIARSERVKAVVLVARWALSAEGKRLEREGKPTVYIKDDLSSEISLEENRMAFKRGLERTIAALRETGKDVLLVEQIPEIGYDVPRLLAKAYVNGGDLDIVLPTTQQYSERQRYVSAVFREMEQEYGARIVRTQDLFCADGLCGIEEDGLPLYSDDNHASRIGAARIVDKVFRSTL